MISFTTLLLFLGPTLALFLSPGPNMAFVLSHAVAMGPRGGLAVALGIGMADVVLTVLTVTGVAGMVAAWPPSFDLLRWAGAAYLLWMAWHAWHHPGQLTVQAAGAQSLAHVCRRSALNSLLNPKALLFFLVFLPQFVETPSATPVAVQLALLGGVLTVASVVFHGLLGLVGGRLAQALSQRLAQRPALARTQGRVLATVLGALALRLLLTQRPAA
jgi:threonine/homoserine/homoserine lactone efflux protein